MAEIRLNDLLKIIDTDAWVIQKNIWGDLEHRAHSSVVNTCYRIQAEEALYNELKNSNGMAFAIECETKGVRVTKRFPTADCFYYLLFCDWKRVPERYGLGLRSNEIAAILNRFNVQETQFTGHPLAMITEGALEADIVNAITKRLYETLYGESLVAKIQTQRRDLRNAYTKAERLLHRQLEHHGCLIGLPLNLRYRADYPKKTVISHADKHLQRFLTSLENQENSTGLVGYWWKHEYLNELGYQHFVLLWFRPTGTRRDALANAIRVAWDDTTTGYGHVVSNEFDERIPRSWGMQSQIMKGSVQLQYTLRSIQLMLLRDQYCRLSLWGATQPFGFSPLPRPILNMAGQMGMT